MKPRTCSDILRLIGACVLAISLGVSERASAALPFRTDDPSSFFTNVAGLLLRTELNLDLNQIQVYPTNQYTPAVHRLLQVTANIYDCTTNRVFNGAGYPYCPTVFRPLFRRTTIGTNTVVVIHGYREVSGTTLIAPVVGAPEIELDSNAENAAAIPPLGTPPGIDREEPLVSGIPLVIGARKGFPNFNEFAMQTYVHFTRMLEFRRNISNGPIMHTNQLYVAFVTNAFGFEAWNSYLSAYPRPLQMSITAIMTAIITNETGTVLLSNRFVEALPGINFAAGTWAGWTNPAGVESSFVLPWGTNAGVTFLPNSQYDVINDVLAPFTHVFSAATQDQYFIPTWWLNLNTRVRYVLVDTAADRIVDYVDLNYWEPVLSLNELLAPPGTDCSGNPSSYTDQGVFFCTNRNDYSFNPESPTMGMINQIGLNLGLNPAVYLPSYSLDPYVGSDAEAAVDSFRYNLNGWGPLYPKDLGKPFYRSNVFFAPLLPNKPIYVHTSWQASDPLLHYTLADVADENGLTNRVNNISSNPPLINLGRPNLRYQPWGGSPFGAGGPSPIGFFQLGAKDPGVLRPDDWDFPMNQPLNPSWLGRVHRGTPWQTIFLKSTNVLQQFPSFWQNLNAWQSWTGDYLEQNDWPMGQLSADALLTAPTNDWHLVSVLAPLLNTNSPLDLASVNQPNAGAWTASLDGMTALTNSAPWQLDPVLLSSNLPQVTAMANGLDRTRNQEPNGVFRGVGDILATPELSTASPWLNLSGQAEYYLTDAAFEIVPAQLLSIVRPDSVLAASQIGGMVQLRVSGCEAYTYVLETSADLASWVSVSTNSPTNGVFELSEPITPGAASRFYRTRLEPGG
jgi:hypothetical protein